MKRIKKLASLLLAMMMILSMGLTAFATEVTEPEDKTQPGNTTVGTGNFSLTISDKTEGYTYAIYQIFKGDLSKDGNTKTLSNIKWGASVDEAEAAKHFTKKDADGNVVAMTASEVAASISSDSNEFDTQVAKDFAANIAKCISGATVDENKNVILPKTSYAGKVADFNESTGYTFTGLDAGYYMVANTDAPQDGENVALTRYMMEIIGDVTATPKKGIPTTEKKILDRQLVCENTAEDHEHNDECYQDKVDFNEASIGDDVTYEITGTMPTNIADYKTYYYVFEDTLSKGLTFKKDSVEVTVDGVDVKKYFYIGATEYDEEEGTVITIGIEDLLALKELDIIENITAATKVVVTYKATLNENAVIAGEGNPNDVKLIYSNDPNNSGDGSTTPPENPEKPQPTHPTGETPKDEVVTFTTELTILKTNEKEAFLPGVQFTLTGEGVNIVLVTEETFTVAAEGEYWKLKDGTYTTTAPIEADDETDNTDDYDSTETKYTKTTSVVAKGNGKTETDVVGTVQADGTVTFKGLGVGEYTITETKTLPGYNTIDPIKFNLTFNAATKKFDSDNKNVSVGEANVLETKIINQSGSLLPSTGGIGTTIFYIVGGILVIGAGILLVAKKRMSAK